MALWGVSERGVAGEGGGPRGGNNAAQSTNNSFQQSNSTLQTKLKIICGSHHYDANAESKKY